MCPVTDPTPHAAPTPAARPDPLRLIPPPSRHPLTPVLLGLMFLSLIPALILAFQRVGYEQAQKTAALVMDYPALVAQAKRYGQDPQALLDRYKALGVNGVALYEDVIGSLEQRGAIYIRAGSDLTAENPGLGLKPGSVYMRSLEPGVAEALPAQYTIPTRTVTVKGQQWIEWPTDPRFLPAGPDQSLLARLKSQNLTLVYRPYADDAVKNVGANWPDVPFIAFTGDEVIGARTPELLAQVSERMGKRIPAIIESNPQRGLDDLVAAHGGARMFALNPSWQNRLAPLDVASKYNLAARERGMRLMYLRPYPTINETEDMLRRTSELLRASGVRVTQPQITYFEPSTLLRALSIVGPLAALLLLGLSFPLRRLGLAAAGLSLLVAFGMNKFSPFAGAALVAAVTFPALGMVLRRSRVSDWFVATGLSLMGVLFVSALGATHDSTLGLDPFRGVGLTLVLPLALVAASFLPRQDLRKTAHDLYSTPIRLGDIAVMGLGLAVFALVFLRRGNTTSGASVSDTEADIRRGLQDSIIRPRFKEMAAHPIGLIGLSGVLPGYFSALLVLGGVVGQASILNTFSHFHTPLLISAARAFIGLGVGLVAGLVLIQVIKLALRLWNTYGRPPAQGTEVRA